VGAKLPPVSSIGVISSRSEERFARDPYIGLLMKGIGMELSQPARIQNILHPEDHGWDIDELPPVDGERLKAEVQGLIATEANNAGFLNDLVRTGLPVTAVDFYAPHASFDIVMVDHQHAGYLATSHLLSIGYRRVGFIGEGPNAGSTDPTWQDRLTGYLRAMAEAGGETGGHWILNISRNSGQIARAMPGFHRRHRLTAYVLCSGTLLQGTVKALGTLGLSCPRDVSLVSADNAARKLGELDLSHARVVYELVGRTAVRMLASRLACRAMPAMRVLHPVSFRPGDTCRQPQV
jgi:DNA-binding LacI/PurR family transcriptional regulator